MSTRSTTHFQWDGNDQAIVYRHFDGYLEGAGADLVAFIDELAGTLHDPRFGDPTYLAAKWIVWLAHHATEEGAAFGEPVAPRHPCSFTGIGVYLVDPGDIVYRYCVECGRHDDAGRPLLSYQEAQGFGVTRTFSPRIALREALASQAVCDPADSG